MERVICQGDDVAELLACVLLRAIDEGELFASRPAKLVGADDAQERGESELPMRLSPCLKIISSTCACCGLGRKGITLPSRVRIE